jgi:transposase
LKQQQHISAYIFGAVCPAEEKASALILPDCNMDMMEFHLGEIERTLKPGKHVVLLLDQASWHSSQNLKCPPRITLVPIPPYSPELNPMEQVWQWIKYTCLSNSVFKDYDHIVDSTVKAWNRFLEECSIKTMCSRAWAKVGC